MARNKQLKMRDKSDPYEVWVSPDGQWKWKVLKKWQLDDNKPFGRWFCCVSSPFVGEDGSLGDCYVTDVKRGNIKLEGEGRP